MFKLSGIPANKKLFKEAIENCDWLKYKSFKPGLWAMDNFALYTLFNILERIKPKNILEFGMGQSSKMVHQYAQFFENVTAVTIEHNREWAEAFCKNIPEDLKINVKFFDTEIIKVNGFKTLTYKNIDDIWGKGGYDLIIVDGPFGSKHHSRSQIVNIIKYGLPEHFCIFMDDTERNGEKETVKEICRELGEKGIKHLVKENRGIRKHHTIIYSADTVWY